MIIRGHRALVPLCPCTALMCVPRMYVPDLSWMEMAAACVGGPSVGIRRQLSASRIEGKKVGAGGLPDYPQQRPE